MNEIKLRLCCCSELTQRSAEISLSSPEEIDPFMEEEFEREQVFNDVPYKISLLSESAGNINFVSFCINNEPLAIKERHFNTGEKEIDFIFDDNRIFLDCFGVARIECVIDGRGYVSKNIPIMVHNNYVNQNVINMVDYIYNYGERYLYDNRNHSELKAFSLLGGQKSVEVKLNILRQTLVVYNQCYSFFAASPKRRLINDKIVGAFEKLGAITADTIQYIVSHPEELAAVNFNTGIKVHKQNYQPQNTLITTTRYTEDVYENQVVLHFLRTVISELKSMHIKISKLLSPGETTAGINSDYLNSMACIYSRSQGNLEKYLLEIKELSDKYKKEYLNYSRILKVSEINVHGLPRYTKVFQSIKAYSLIYARMFEWFKFGCYDLNKSDLIFRFISVSKIYEYYCLIKINHCLEKHCGYSLRGGGYSFKYHESRYYKNTMYNNTFEFINTTYRNKKIAVYYQPVVFGGNQAGANELTLFRNTKYSLSSYEFNAADDSEEFRSGFYYVPDFIIKITDENNVKYFVLDAKFSRPETVIKHQLPGLVFKYLFSMSTVNPADSIAGIFLLCGKGTGADNTRDLYNTQSPLRETPISPSAKLLELNGTNTGDYSAVRLMLDEIVNG